MVKINIFEILRNVKNILVSNEIKYRRVWFGLASGCYLPINLANNFRALFGLSEIEISRYIKDSVKSGSCCYDVGAALGYYSIVFGKLASPGEVIAIESDRGPFQILEKTIKTNSKLKTKFFPLNSFVGSGDSIENNSITLDNLVFEKRFNPPDIIKIDIEGGEYNALIGSRKTIKQFSPIIILEVHSFDLEQKCIGFLEKYGYKVEIIKQNKYLTEKRPIQHNRWIFCKKPN